MPVKSNMLKDNATAKHEIGNGRQGNPAMSNIDASSLDDSKAIKRVLDGDIALFEVLVRRYNQRL